MAHPLSNKTKLNEIRHTLFEFWDPIGLKDNAGPQDEYDLYAERLLYKFQENVVNYDDLTQFLQNIAENEMELSSADIETRCKLAAKELYVILKR